MRSFSRVSISLLVLCILFSCTSKDENSPNLQFDFENTLKSDSSQFTGKGYSFAKGIDGKALALNPKSGYQPLELGQVSLDGANDFSVQFWVKTTSKLPTVLLSQKDFTSKGILTQKNAGWAFYSSNGTFGWNIGSGKRRINYERDNGKLMPINDGEWHQMTVTYSKKDAEFRLYYDGHNKAVYKVNFDFQNNNPIRIGAAENTFDYDTNYVSEIESGLTQLQSLVDEFNTIGLKPLKNEEFLDLIVDPGGLLKSKLKLLNRKLPKKPLSKVSEIRRKLGANPYTVFQNMNLTVLKPVNKIYSLQSGKVIINHNSARSFTKSEQLFPSDFSIDKLAIWENTLQPNVILNSYKKYKKSTSNKLPKELKNFTVGVWNIWHGGIHWSLKKDGWDSRMRIVEMIKEKNIDVILMQETYSNGDFIAAELGYYFATTSDWDYKYQGANISVISRYPIKEIEVYKETEFNNVAVKLAISNTQEAWAMSNWYGMNSFPKVYESHKSKFENSDTIPVFFGGDFNAVPHTDGGKSIASEKLQKEGFTDAYRSIYPNVVKNPGFTHQENIRIDQLYYKGKGLENNFTEVISTWPKGFPSDHFLIVSKFKLNYQTKNINN